MLFRSGTKFGCGTGLCGACTVHVDGSPARSCQTPLARVAGKQVTTIEGLAPNGEHPLQKAWIAEQVPQCGYCQSGMLCRATQLLIEKPKPSAADAAGMPNVCVCGTYQRVQKAVLRASGQ